MAEDELFPVITRHRLALVETLSGLRPEEWATPSWWNGRTVRDVATGVLAHLEAASGPGLVRAVRSRTDRRVAAREAALRERPLADLVERLRTLATRAGTTRGWRAPAVLAELLLHIRDVERPLDRPCQLEPEATERALRHIAEQGLGRLAPAERGAGLELVAVDLGLCLGSGSRLEGSGEAILLALCGRRGALADLKGPGATILGRRLGVRPDRATPPPPLAPGRVHGPHSRRG